MIGIAAGILLLSVLVWWGPGPGTRLARLRPREAVVRRRTRWIWVPPTGAVVLLALLSGRPGFVLAGAAVVAAVLWLVRRSRRVRELGRAQAEIATAVTSLTLLMRAGMIPTVALREAAMGSPCLASAATASGLGIDVGRALRGSAARPGFGGLQEIAAAWQVSERTGAPVAAVVGRVAETVRERQQLQGVLEAEMSAARISGRVMAGLPLLGLALGSVMGAGPVAFLTQHWAGQWLVLAAVGLSIGGVVWTELIAGKEPA